MSTNKMLITVDIINLNLFVNNYFTYDPTKVEHFKCRQEFFLSTRLVENNKIIS